MHNHFEFFRSSPRLLFIDSKFRSKIFIFWTVRSLRSKNRRSFITLDIKFCSYAKKQIRKKLRKFNRRNSRQNGFQKKIRLFFIKQLREVTNDSLLIKKRKTKQGHLTYWAFILRKMLKTASQSVNYVFYFSSFTSFSLERWH